MKINKTPLDGLLTIDLQCFEDERGFFIETYQEQRYVSAGITDKFVQSNQSRSKKNILRGMHFQVNSPQSQIVTIMRGHIFDVAVDMRINSKTFGKWYGIELADNGIRQIYMAPGFAHGFCVLSDYADLHYKVSRYYDPDDEGGLVWNDQDVGIEWPSTSYDIASRDSAFPTLKECINLYDMQ